MNKEDFVPPCTGFNVFLFPPLCLNKEKITGEFPSDPSFNPQQSCPRLAQDVSCTKQNCFSLRSVMVGKGVVYIEWKRYVEDLFSSYDPACLAQTFGQKDSHLHLEPENGYFSHQLLCLKLRNLKMFCSIWDNVRLFFPGYRWLGMDLVIFIKTSLDLIPAPIVFFWNWFFFLCQRTSFLWPGILS